MQKASVPSLSSVAVFCFAADIFLRFFAWMSERFFIWDTAVHMHDMQSFSMGVRI